MPSLLTRQFYEQDVLDVAERLLGQRLVRVLNGRRLSGIITETEAYRHEEDLACHARAGRTPRTQVMYGPAGISYVYFTYGMHWLLNAVCEPVDTPAAVLVRAIEPDEGLDLIARHRPGVSPNQWCNGPAKICMALGITGMENGLNLCDRSSGLFIEQGESVASDLIIRSGRVGINSVPEPWRSLPWRFRVKA